MPEPLLRVVDLQKHFPVRAGLFGRVREWVRAVAGVSLEIHSGQTLGLVGESGCGKTTVGRTLLRLTEPSGGRVYFDGLDLTRLKGSELRLVRKRMQLIFQDPFGSLNPRMTVEQIVGEPLWYHGVCRGRELGDRVADLMRQVGLRPEAAGRYPHEFSGGQRQRIGIARALALEPAFIVCDEPTSALDVSIRAQIVNLLQDLQQARGLSYLMISHDLGVVRHISAAVAVMYLGKIVEQAPTEPLYERPRHPYTQLLLGAIPIPDPRRRGAHLHGAAIAAGDDSVPSPINLPTGCAFHPRCPLYRRLGSPTECSSTPPPLQPLAENPRHLVRCHFAEQSTPKELGETTRP